MPKYSPIKTVTSGCLVAADSALLTAFIDSLPHSEWAFSRVSMLNISGSEMWLYHDYDWVAMSAAVYSVGGLRCVLSREGAVNLYGPGGTPDHTFQLPGAGVFNKGAQGYGYVSRIRSVDAGLYVCGDHRQFYHFDWDGKSLAGGRWQDMAGAMRQAPVSDAPPAEEKAYDQWLDAQSDSVEFRDIGGTEANDLYAVGDEVWHFSGKQWQQVKLPTDEPLNAIKAVDAQRVVIVGHNGTVLLGNAKQGFKDISSVDDNQNFTGVEYFQDKLWLASNLGLFVYDFTKGRIAPYQTDLEVDLVDAHQLEAKDGVLWSFGYKDLAYWDSNKGNAQWVRVHHPDNPRVDEVQAKKASRQPPPAPNEAALGEEAAALASARAWLPKPRTGVLDIGGLMARVGHSGIGDFVLEQLQAFGLKSEQILQHNKGQRYTVEVPKQGVRLTLQYDGPKGHKAATAKPAHWALAEVQTQTQNANAYDCWTGSWLAGINPYATDLSAHAQKLWGDATGSGLQRSYFVDGPYGAAWVINLEWTGVLDRLRHLKVLHLGGYLPWSDAV